MKDITVDMQNNTPDDFFQQRELLRKTYVTGIDTLKEQLMYLDQEAKALEAQLNDYNKVVESNRGKTQEMIEENAKKEHENQQLASNIRRIKIENARLSTFKSYIFNTFDIPTDKAIHTAVERASPKTEVYNVPNVIVQPYKYYFAYNDSKAQYLINEIDEGIQKNIEAASPVKFSSKRTVQLERTPQQSLVEEHKEFSGMEYNKSPQKMGSSLIKPMEPTLLKKDNSTPVLSKSVQYVDGKKFFELAREKLSFEDFNKVIREIQKMNKNQQSKQTTYETCENITRNKDKELSNKLRSLIYHKVS